jgi:signal transduction histidine kinase
MSRRRSLRYRIIAWLGVFAVLMSAAISLHGYLINERAERLVWDGLLRTHLDHHLERAAQDPGYRWRDTDSLRLYASTDGRPLPGALAGLAEGVHDELAMGDRQYVVYVADLEGVRYTLALDITEFESDETVLSLYVALFSLLLAVLVGALAAWGVARLLRPVSDLAADIERLDPNRPGQRVSVRPGGGTELQVIAGAVNHYLARHEQFVERERQFINTASHELRTPIAVIAGATELALAQADLPAATRNQIDRAHRTARDVEQLISLLLVLAKEPARLAKANDRVALDRVIPDIIEDHRYLSGGKDLAVTASPLPSCEIVAPLAIVQAAIGNLLRNAIENSDRGEIRVTLSEDATVTIEDPGHGMTPEEISRIYARVARGGERGGSGIGLELMSRLCEHLGWRLTLRSTPGQGTVSRLEFAAA